MLLHYWELPFFKGSRSCFSHIQFLQTPFPVSELVHAHSFLKTYYMNSISSLNINFDTDFVASLLVSVVSGTRWCLLRKVQKYTVNVKPKIIKMWLTWLLCCMLKKNAWSNTLDSKKSAYLVNRTHLIRNFGR